MSLTVALTLSAGCSTYQQLCTELNISLSSLPGLGVSHQDTVDLRIGIATSLAASSYVLELRLHLPRLHGRRLRFLQWGLACGVVRDCQGYL